MLALRKNNPPAVVVDLGAGASIRVRPASVMEVLRAEAGASLLIIGLVAGAETAMTAAAALGEDFIEADFTDDAWVRAAVRRLTLLKLAAQCCEGWDGVGDETGELLELTEGNLALLLRDPVLEKKISTVIEAPVHREFTEKNGSAASPNGAAAADEPTAPNAGEASHHAPSVMASTASAAPNSSTRP